MPEVSQRAWIVTWRKKETVSVHTTAPVYLGFHKLNKMVQAISMTFLYIKNENLYDYISFASTDSFIYDHVYRVSQEECAILRESVPYVKLYRYNPKHLYPKLNGYGDNGQRSLKL